MNISDIAKKEFICLIFQFVKTFATLAKNYDFFNKISINEVFY